MRRHKGFSLIELLIVCAVILIIAAIAIPNMLKSRAAANEASAVQSLRQINTAEMTYVTMYNTYTCNLQQLGPVTGGGVASSASAGILDANLSSGNKSGYTFTAGTCDTAGSQISTFQWLADPAAATSGSRHFCTDDTFIIKVDPNSGSNCLSIGTAIQ